MTAIFQGRVMSEMVKGANPTDGPTVVRFSVTESFKGAESKEIEIENAPGCFRVPFVVGHEYMIYAQPNHGALVTTPTDVESPAEAAAEIQQFRKQQLGNVPASLFGVVMRHTSVLMDENASPISGLEVELRGEKGSVFTSRSNAAGAYEFIGLPPDHYTLRPLLPSGMLGHADDFDVSVDKGESCQRDVWVENDSAQSTTGRP